MIAGGSHRWTIFVTVSDKTVLENWHRIVQKVIFKLPNPKKPTFEFFPTGCKPVKLNGTCKEAFEVEVTLHFNKMTTNREPFSYKFKLTL